jgi:hypothetical protein
MGGVDRNDEMKSYYAIKFRSRKWWHRVFFELLDRCVVNGHILELELPNHERRTLKEFRLDLAKKLIGDFTSRKRPGRPSMELTARLTEIHFPSHLPTNEKGKVKERRCRVCSTKDKPKKTSYWCAELDCAGSMFPHSQHTPINQLNIEVIDILYTLDSASNYSAIQKLKP